MDRVNQQGSLIEPCCDGDRLLKMLFLQEFTDLIGDLNIVQIRKGEVRISFNTDFGQVDDGDIATVFVYYLLPPASHRQPDSPTVLRRHCDRFVRNVIPIKNQDWDFSQGGKLRPVYRLAF